MSVHFDVRGVEVRCRIRLQDKSNFATVDVVVEISNSQSAGIDKESDSAIELDSKQLVAMSQISCVVKESGTTACEASCAHPPQRAVRIDDDRCEYVATAFNHDVIVAQLSAVRSGLKLGRS